MTTMSKAMAARANATVDVSKVLARSPADVGGGTVTESRPGLQARISRG